MLGRRRAAPPARFGTRPLTARRRVAQVLLGALMACVVLLGGAPVASAQLGGVGASVVPEFPPVVTVGDRYVSVALRFQNTSTGELAA